MLYSSLLLDSADIETCNGVAYTDGRPGHEDRVSLSLVPEKKNRKDVCHLTF